MTYFSIDHCLVYGYLLLVLLLGLYVGRRNKDIKDYALAGKAFGSGILMMTFVATTIGGGSTMGLVTNVYLDGIIASAFECVLAFVPFMLGIVLIAPNLHRMRGCMTMGDVMDNFYGTGGKVISGLVVFMYCTSLVAGQTLAIGFVLESLLGIERVVGILVGGVITILYSAFGGIKAVALTDVLQFLVLIIAIPMVTSAAIRSVGINSLGEFLAIVPPEKLVIFHYEKIGYYFVLFFSLPLVYMLEPPRLHRVLMAENKRQVKKMYFNSAILYYILTVLVTFIGLVAITMDNINPKLALAQVIQQLMPVGMKGFVIAGLLAVIMSTFDSFLNTGGLSFTHDVVKPMADKWGQPVNELRIVKWLTLGMGTISITMAIFLDNILRLNYYVAGILGCIVTIPLLLGIIGLKTNKKDFRVTIVIAITTFLVSSWVLPASLSYLPPFLGLVGNAIAYLSLHLIRNKGLAFMPRVNPDDIEEA